MSLNELLRDACFDWHGVKLDQPDWRYDSHSLSVTVWAAANLLFHLMLNSYREPLDFELPLASGAGKGPWRRLIDTSLESPDDFCRWSQAPRISGETYRLRPHSIAFLFSHVKESL